MTTLDWCFVGVMALLLIGSVAWSILLVWAVREVIAEWRRINGGNG